MAAYSRYVTHSGSWTLDGASYLAVEDPDAYAAYLWLIEHQQPGDVVVEAPGEEYDPTTSRMSTLTGLPTILGWPGHEVQWRGNDAFLIPRERDLRTIYSSIDQDEILQALEHYGARYVYVGPRERALYGITAERLSWLAEWMEPAFASGEVMILAVVDPR
jgi:uncharacterized membrane protein